MDFSQRPLWKGRSPRIQWTLPLDDGRLDAHRSRFAIRLPAVVARG